MDDMNNKHGLYYEASDNDLTKVCGRKVNWLVSSL